MDTRVRRAWLAAATAAAACTGAPSARYGAVTPVTSGDPGSFGAGLVWARPTAVAIELAAPAYVVVARFGAIGVGELVYPLDAPDWLEFGYPGRGTPPAPLGPGRHRLDLPLPWQRIDGLPGSRREPTRESCRFRNGAWACASWAAWHARQRDRAGRYYGPLPAPDSLAEHHFVVLVARDPLNLAALRARLEDLNEGRLAALAAAQAAPAYLTARHDGPWAGYAATVRIRGAR